MIFIESNGRFFRTGESWITLPKEGVTHLRFCQLVFSSKICFRECRYISIILSQLFRDHTSSAVTVTRLLAFKKCSNVLIAQLLWTTASCQLTWLLNKYFGGLYFQTFSMHYGWAVHLVHDSSEARWCAVDGATTLTWVSSHLFIFLYIFTIFNNQSLWVISQPNKAEPSLNWRKICL